MTIKLPVPDRDTLYRMYVVEGLTTPQIGTAFRCSVPTVRRWLRSAGIPVRRPGARKGSGGAPSDETLRRYNAELISTTEIAEIHGVETGTVSGWYCTSRIPRCRIRVLRDRPDAEEIATLYIDEQMSLEAMGRHYGVSTQVILDIMDAHGIERRRAGYRGPKEMLIARDGHVVRSDYERLVCDWLFEHHLVHEYEPPLFKRFAADFKVGAIYIEVWGVNGNIAYERRKAIKRAYLAERGLELVEIPRHAFEAQHDDLWSRRLAKALLP